MKQTLFALIDCNNFFVSCERIFRPDLEDKPVVVLSSNDGCAVARSNEAKALGIPMAAPVFKYRQILNDHNVVQFSGNFELYGDISRRIIELLASITPRIEVYSVDESFLDLSELPINDFTAWGRMVREKILTWIGVPVSIGIAPSKTLAKLASDRAKKDPALNGVLCINTNGPDRETHLKSTPVEDVWGVGWRLAPRLRAEGVGSAYDLQQLRPRRAQQLMGIHGRQMVYELNGISCLPLETVGKIRKSIMATRTFGQDTSEFNVLEAAIANFTAVAAFKLRSSGQLARRAGIFLDTNKHKPGYKRWSRELNFKVPIADTGILTGLLIKALGEVYNPHLKYHRAGVMLHDFVPNKELQTDLFDIASLTRHDTSTRRMIAVDSINNRYGKRTIKYAAENLGTVWRPRYNLRSPRYTSRWNELAVIKNA